MTYPIVQAGALMLTGELARPITHTAVRTRTRAAALRQLHLVRTGGKSPLCTPRNGHQSPLPLFVPQPHPGSVTIAQQCRRRASGEPGTILDPGERQRTRRTQTPSLPSYIHTGPLRHPALPPPSSIRASWSHAEGPVAGGGREACGLVLHIQGRPTLPLQVISK